MCTTVQLREGEGEGSFCRAFAWWESWEGEKSKMADHTCFCPLPTFQLDDQAFQLDGFSADIYRPIGCRKEKIAPFREPFLQLICSMIKTHVLTFFESFLMFLYLTNLPVLNGYFNIDCLSFWMVKQ